MLNFRCPSGKDGVDRLLEAELFNTHPADFQRMSKLLIICFIKEMAVLQLFKQTAAFGMCCVISQNVFEVGSAANQRGQIAQRELMLPHHFCQALRKGQCFDHQAPSFIWKTGNIIAEMDR